MKKVSQKGQALVEFALIFPLLIILLFGIIEFSILLYDKAIITNASREGARVGIVSQDRSNLGPINTSISDAVNAYCKNRLISFGSSKLSVTPDWSGGITFGCPLKIIVTWEYKWLVFPNFIEGFGKLSKIGAVSTMRLE